MIFVSSSCIRTTTIGDAVKRLADDGFNAIELSGGTQLYPALERDLLHLQKEYGLHYLCHNYFPPPAEPFVVNLASLDEQIFQLSINHLLRAIELSRKLGASKFGFHAGFLMDIPLNQLGQSIEKKQLFDRNLAMNRFVESLDILKGAAQSVDLYVENNVVSSTNLKNYGGENPLLVTDLVGYNELVERIPFGLLLDVAHLKVSCNSLGLDFEMQLEAMVSGTDYIHVSDNDGYTDSNNKLEEGSDLWNSLKRQDLKGKIFTLEVYTGIKDVKSSYEALKGIVG